MTGWWRTNRWWLPALPVAVALLVVASSYNVRDYWYLTGLHHEVGSSAADGFVEVSEEYDDALGTTTRTYQVRFTSLGQADEYTLDFGDPQPLAEGQEAVVVHLDWQAAPDQMLRGCTVAVVDDEGRRYEIVGSGQANVCTPDGHDGPDLVDTEAGVRGQAPAGEERPETWTTAPVFLVPEGTEVRQVLVWFRLPDYVSLPVT